MRSLIAQRWIDALVVLLALIAQADVWGDPAQRPWPVAAPAALLWTLPLLLRRRFPLAAPAVVFAALGVESFLPGQVVTNSQVNPWTLLAAFWVVGTHPSQRTALAGGAIGYCALALIVLNEAPDAPSTVALFLLGAAAWAVGRALAERDRRAEELEQAAERLQSEHETAVLVERARIAGELHDVIAHSVSVMTVQAGAARLLLEEDPARAREPLISVEETGREALGEMRRLLGMLRGAEDEAGLAPQPGMAQLVTLVEQVRSAGLPVEVAAIGRQRPLAPGVDLTAYRVVQEALTNVLKHAAGASARVRIRYGSDALELEVLNDGQAKRNGRPGQGLVGMRQRVALYGGQLEAGPGRDGGYEVRARLPLGQAQA